MTLSPPSQTPDERRDAPRRKRITQEQRDRQVRANELLAQASSVADPQERARLLDAVVVLLMPMAQGIARRQQGKGVPLEDLEQVACLALTQAARRFDPARQSDFLSFAVPTIRGELKKYFRDHGWTVRPPRHIQELQPLAIAARTDLHQRLGREPAVAEIAQVIGAEQAAVDEALGARGCFQPASLDRPVTPAAPESMLDLLPGDTDEAAREAAEARVLLAPVVRRLKERDRRILRMRFDGNCTQQQIAEELGVTQMQVSRLLRRILRDLRRELS